MADKECRPALLLTEKAAPRKLCRRHPTTGFRHKGPRRARSGAFRSRPGAQRWRLEANEDATGVHRSEVGSAMTRNADTTVPRNAHAEQRAAREQWVIADEHKPKPPLEAPRRLPERIQTRLTGDGDRVAAPACGDRGRVHGLFKEQRCRQRRKGGAQKENAAKDSQVGASEPANLEGQWLGENEAAQKELLHPAQEPGKKADQLQPHEESCEAPGELMPQGGEHKGSSKESEAVTAAERSTRWTWPPRTSSTQQGVAW
jgi:hypothetical protein